MQQQCGKDVQADKWQQVENVQANELCGRVRRLYKLMQCSSSSVTWVYKLKLMRGGAAMAYELMHGGSCGKCRQSSVRRV